MLHYFNTAVVSLQIKHKAFTFIETQEYSFVYLFWKILHS